MNVEAVKTLALASGLFGSEPVTSKNGMNPNQVFNHRDSPSIWPCRRNSPHRP